MSNIQENIHNDKTLFPFEQAALLKFADRDWMSYALQKLSLKQLAQYLVRWGASVEPFVIPAFAGRDRAIDRGIEKDVHNRTLYANTPVHPITRQQRRYKAQHA